MTQTKRYIEWKSTNSTADKVAETVRHYQTRFELGSTVLLTTTPNQTQALLVKQWKKLTRQLQQKRDANLAAEEMLSITRTISRMQRVKFTTKSPDQEPDANFYTLSPSGTNSLPRQCLTLYSLDGAPRTAFIELLAPEATTVLFGKTKSVAGLLPKSVLEDQVRSLEADLTAWLASHKITVDSISDSIERSNEALDILLSSSKLQTEFLAKSKLLLHTRLLASPFKSAVASEKRLRVLEQLEKQVRVLSPAFLSDHIIDNQSDDAFLLRDPATRRPLTFEALKAYVAQQYQLGHHHLASALEQKAGFITI